MITFAASEIRFLLMICRLVIFMLFITTALVSGQTRLQYNLQKGEVFMIRQNALQVITQELDGASQEITNEISGVLEFRVVGQKNEDFELSITFKELQMYMSSSSIGQLLAINAKEVSEDDVQSRIFHSLLNEPFHMLLSRNGDILEVRGGDSLVSKMAASSGVADAFALKMMKKSLEKEFGSAALSESYKQMTYIYPLTAISIGDSWQNEYSGKLSAHNTWTLDELTADEARISGKAKVAMDVIEPATTMKLSGTQTTSIIASTATGFIQKMTVTGVSDGISTLTQMGDQKIPTKIKSNITYELINH